MIQPFFKTQYSVGKSLLQPKRVVELAKEQKLPILSVIEDSFYGFRALNQFCTEEEVRLAFGIRLPVVYDDIKEKPSKLVFFGKNNDGIKILKDLYTKTYTSKENLLVFSKIKNKLDDVFVIVPFYDSFVYNNVFHFGMSVMDLDGVHHEFTYEDNFHPFDFQIRRALDKMGAEPKPAKSIYYEKRSDFKAFQMFRAITSRSQGKSPTFGNPNLEHFCSSEFCWESWKEVNQRFS